MKKVTAGKSFEAPADTWNKFIDAASYTRQKQFGVSVKTQRKDSKSGIVLVRNSTEELLEQFALVLLGDLIIKPEDNESDFRGRIPVFEAELIAEANKSKPFGILQKPLSVEECGPLMLSGITPARIKVDNDSHEFAVVDVENSLKSSASGSARILWKAETDDEEDGKRWAIIQLGATVSSFYNGYFAASNSSDEENQKVKITSGHASINNVPFEVKDDNLTEINEDKETEDLDTFAAELIITAEAYIFLQATYDTGSGTISAPTIEQSTTFPLSGANVFRGPIAHIKWNGTDSVIKSIFQIHYGMMYGIITGTC